MRRTLLSSSSVRSSSTSATARLPAPPPPRFDGWPDFDSDFDFDFGSDFDFDFDSVLDFDLVLDLVPEFDLVLDSDLFAAAASPPTPTPTPAAAAAAAAVSVLLLDRAASAKADRWAAPLLSDLLEAAAAEAAAYPDDIYLSLPLVLLFRPGGLFGGAQQKGKAIRLSPSLGCVVFWGACVRVLSVCRSLFSFLPCCVVGGGG
jgi:hypothetical protein